MRQGRGNYIVIRRISALSLILSLLVCFLEKRDTFMHKKSDHKNLHNPEPALPAYATEIPTEDQTEGSGGLHAM